MIELKGITKSFKETKAIDDLTLSVGPGEIVGLLGANGAGKSTTINLIMGLLSPDTGSVSIGGVDVAKDPTTVRQMIGYIPENVNLYPYLSGVENLGYFCKLGGASLSKSKLEELLATCGLQAEAHHKRVETYSKGMRQKVGVAIAYAKSAKVYLLDEPASGLDPVASNELSGLLRQLSESGSSILMASHDLFRVREVCHRIGILRSGSLVKEVTSDQVSASELEDIYLEYMQS